MILDALVSKGSAKDANEECVMRLRVSNNSTDEEIQFQKSLRNVLWGLSKSKKKIGRQAYRLLLPKTWKVNRVFHISLLMKWNAADLQAEKYVPSQELEEEEPYYEIEELLLWRRVKQGRRIKKEYSVLCEDYAISEAQRVS